MIQKTDPMSDCSILAAVVFSLNIGGMVGSEKALEFRSGGSGKSRKSAGIFCSLL